MSYSLVCIARSIGAHGEEVGRLVADGLGFRYVDNEILRWAADKAGVTPATLAQAEKTKPLVIRILETLGRANLAASEGGYVMQPVPDTAPPVKDYAALLEVVIREVADEGQAVIVGHGAGIALQHESTALRVFITGSPEVRALQHARDALLEASKARKAIDSSDHQRKEFLRRLHGISDETPQLYDLVINTDRIPAQVAAELVMQAAR
jgi:cytidylate kinase